MLGQLEAHLDRWSVPSHVRDVLKDAISVVDKEDIRTSDGSTDEYASIAARGKPIALYVGRTRLSMALDPEAATQATDNDRALGLERDSGVTWFVHVSFAALSDPERLNVVRSLVVDAIRRSARNVRDAGASNREERRRAAVESAHARCPVPGCNLPMIGGSCGFHD